MFFSTAYSFTRPADTTQYGANDLVANSTTAGSVVPMQFGVGAQGGKIYRVRLFKSATSATAASFKIHLFSVAPTPTNGDNGALGVDTVANYIGNVSIDQSSGATAGTAGLWKDGTASLGFQINAGAIYGLIEVLGTYTPASGETFTVKLDIES